MSFLAGRSARWLRHAIRWMRRHPVFRRIAGPLLDSSQPEVLSITMMGSIAGVGILGHGDIAVPVTFFGFTQVHRPGGSGLCPGP